MKTINIPRAVIVGIFIFLGVVLFIMAILSIGTRQKTFAKTIAVKAIFDDVSGLQAGNNVWLSGVKIGTVKKISFYGNTQVEVNMSIDRDARTHIAKDSKAKISSDGFIGNRIVIIYGGTSTVPSISDGDIIKSEKYTSMDDMVATLMENNRNLLDITGNFKAISKKINEGKGSLGEVINDPAIADNLHSTINNFKKASSNSGKIIAEVDEFVAGLNKQGSFANDIVSDTTIFSNLRKTIAQLNDASVSISDFAKNMDRAGNALNKKDNPAGVLLNDPQVATDLRSITANLNTSSEKLVEDLNALQHNFLLRGYFRKQAKQKKLTDSTTSHPK